MNVLLIDSKVNDYQVIVNACNTNTLPFVYSYNITRNEISKFFSYISQKINRIGIFADQKATLFLDNEPFFVENENTLFLSDNPSFMVQLIRDYDISYIDYFACNSLNDPNWVNYYDILMSLTDVIVGASNNETGNIQYGGDWIMENTCENIESIYFSKNIEYYKYLLADTKFYVGTGAGAKDITTLFNAGSGGGTGKLITDNYGATTYGSGFRYKSGALYYDMIKELDVATTLQTLTATNTTNYYVLYGSPLDYVDIGQLINPPPVYDTFNLGTPSASTWTIGTYSTELSTSNWIWKANSTGRPTVPSNVNILFSYNYSSNILTTGTFYAAVVGVGFLYFNGSGPTYIGTDTITGLTGATLSGTVVTPLSGSFTIVPGRNCIQIVCYNSGTYAGLIASFYRGSTLEACTDNTWTSQIVSGINNALATVVRGGLNTTVYNVGTNDFKYDNSILGSSNQSYYYNNIDPNIIASTNIVTNFGAITDISSTCISDVGTTYGSDYWGFKASGFFVPPSNSQYTFTLTSNDFAEIWIGNNARTPSIVPTLKSTISSTTQTTSSLTANTYYPILIFYGQQTHGQNFNLVIRQGTSTGTILTHSDVLYYVNYNLPPPSQLPSILSPSRNLRSTSGYCMVLANIHRSTTQTFTVASSIDITIIMVGPGGNGGQTTGTNTQGNGGSGGQVYWAKINLPAGTYIATAGCPGINSTTSGTNTTFRNANGTQILTAYAGTNGASGVDTTVSYATTTDTNCNPTSGGFTIVSPSSTSTNRNPYQFNGGRGGGYDNTTSTTNTDSYGGIGVGSTGTSSSTISQTNFLLIRPINYASIITSVGTSINSRSNNKYYDGSSLITESGTNAYYSTSFSERVVSLYQPISYDSATDATDGRVSSNPSYMMVSFSAGGGGGNKNQVIGGGTGGNYWVGGCKNSGGYSYSGSKLLSTYIYTDAFDGIAGKQLKNGTNGRGFGTGGGGSSSAPGATGGKGGPGAIFIYVG